MNLDWLRTFSEVVERRSYSRAAEALFITQPAVSQHIKNLERAFGVDLRVRGEREFRTTEAGERVYELARRITNDIFQVTEHIKRDRLISKRVTIGSGLTPLTHYLPTVFREFWRENPSVDIRTFMTTDAPRVTEALIAGEVDVAIQILRHIPPWLCRTPCFEDEFIAVVNPTHRLVGKAALGAKDLAEERIAMAPRPSESREMIAGWFADRGVLDLRSVECESFDQARAVALAGPAVAFVTRLVVIDDLAAARLCELPVEGLELRRLVYAVWHPDPIVEVAALVDVIERLYGDAQAFL